MFPIEDTNHKYPSELFPNYRIEMPDLLKSSKAGSKSSIIGSRQNLAASSANHLNRASSKETLLSPTSSASSKPHAVELDIDNDSRAEEISREKRIKAGIFPLFLTSVTQSLFKIRPEDFPSAESPAFKLIPKSDLISDMTTRLAISDFHPAKAPILEYPGEEILVCQDKDFRYGQNFFVAVTADAVDAYLKPIVAENNNESRVEMSTLPAKSSRKVWECLGSDKDMEFEAVVPSRDLIIVKASKKLKDFGAQCKFGDRDAHDGFLECRPYRDANYEVSRSEVSVGVQAVAGAVGVCSQTTWNRPQNFCAQYEPILMSPAEQASQLSSSSFIYFLRSVTHKLSTTLLTNELLDIFTDEYAALGEDDTVALEQATHVHLQEYQSFTDLKHSRDRSISCIHWHPTLKGVLGISCVCRSTLDERIEAESRASSLILIWSFQDPIHPKLILEAPDDILHFKFNFLDPNIVVGGCASGQVVLWDISDHQEKLKTNRKVTRATEGEIEDSGDTPAKDKGRISAAVETVRWIAVSSIEGSHRGPVVDLHWMPEGMEISNTGEIVEGDSACRQLVTSSADGSVFYWDTRYKKELKALDLVWKPFLRVPLSAIDNTFDYGLTRVSIRAGITDTNTALTDNNSQLLAAASPGVQANQKISPISSSTTSKFYCATEEGDIIIADWTAEKSNEDKNAASRVEHAFSKHFGTISDLRRSPFFPDIVLSVGGWSFHIWKEGHNAGPLLSSSASSTYVISGVWSPTRPGVFFISRTDGSIEVWDLLDRSHAPSSIQNVSSTAISYMDIHHYQGTPKSRSVHQFIAVGDDEGTLHILEAPRNLTRPLKNEKTLVRTLFEREVRRIGYVQERKEFRLQERAKFDMMASEAAALAAIALQQATIAGSAAKTSKAPKKEEVSVITVPLTVVTDEEGEKIETEYLKMEREFLELEGLITVT